MGADGNRRKYLKTANVKDMMPHMGTVVEVRPPEEYSTQDLVNELARRALQPLGTGAKQKAVSASWVPVKKKGGKL